jgi:DNA (cytosine-5)-methyltransferase 1
MMGLTPGWVTDVPGLSRSDMLRVLGNGVVPQQAALAVWWLLSRAGLLAEAGEAA